MKGLIERLSAEQNGLQIKLFEYQTDDDSLQALMQYLYAKIRNSKLHKVEDYGIQYYSAKNMDADFIQKLNERIQAITTPRVHAIPQFSVQRERITEWIAEMVLKEKFNCIFYDEADKRMNIDPVNIDKHTSGIDVPGIYMQDDTMKFVVCEVKASDAKKCPQATISSLNDDINKAIHNDGERVSKEILQYMSSVKDIHFTDEMLDKIFLFLEKLIMKSSDEFVKDIVFFPFLIRSEGSVLETKDVRDFSTFQLTDVDKENVKNILLVLQKNLNEFSNDVYKNALDK